MKRALIVFLITSALGLIALIVVARTAWRYGDTPGGTAQRQGHRRDPERRHARGDVVDAPQGRRPDRQPDDLPAVRRPARRRRALQGGPLRDHRARDAEADPRHAGEGRRRRAGDGRSCPTGKNLLEVAEILDAAGIAGKAELAAKASDPAFAAELGLPGNTLEGYLFPDTYRLRPRSTPARALIPLVRRHRQVWGELRAAHAKAALELKKTLGFDDHKIVVLASIVEKETGRPEERPRIAQVFINRLRMPTFVPKLLQTDPTIIYGCTVATPRSAACQKWDGRIRRIHLDDRDNPYNTYTHEGLPPGPISNPGRAALEAVLAPDHTPFLYFVAKNDGTHQFSRTVAEHNAAVVKYQRGGKALGRNERGARASSPRGWARSSTRPPAWARCCAAASSGGPIAALADVSFTVAPGEIVCVMGPNGAGKSTLVRILGGLLLPSSGSARVGGVDAGTGGSAFRRRVAFVVGDERSFHYRVSGRANLHYFAALHGLPRGEARRRAAALLERVGLARRRRSPLPRVLARHAAAARARARAARPIRRCCCSTSRRWGWIRAARATCARSCATR